MLLIFRVIPMISLKLEWIIPSFQGNNAVSVKSHLFAFANWWKRFAVANNNFDDVKMRLFVLTFEQDVAEWFTEKPDNSFDTFESIVVAFKDKYGDKREDRHLVKEISTIKKKENETIEEFNRRFNVTLGKYLKLISLLMDLF